MSVEKEQAKLNQLVEYQFAQENTPLPKASYKGGIINRFGLYLVTMWKYFFTALELDQEDNATAKKTGKPVPNKWANLENWFKLFGTGFIILICSGIIIWRFINPPKRSRYKDNRRNHHGYRIDNGKRY
jgi:hypothetical protein